MEPATVHNELTQLLFKAGCTISKPAIDELVEWVRNRDNSIIEAMQKKGDEMKRQAHYSYGIETKETK